MRRWFRDKSGATSIEYALLAALMSVLLIAAVRSIGISTGGVFNQVSSGFATR